MVDNEGNPRHNKISSEFAARLTHLAPNQKVRAIVMLTAQGPPGLRGRRQSDTERQTTIETMRKSAAQALGNIDDILQRYEGKRLTDNPDALGSIPIEIIPAGIDALAASEWVKAIIEDQEIKPIM